MRHVLTVGRNYTRKEITKILGGSTQNYLPHKNGRVLYGCFRTDLNPGAPSEILPGNTDDIRLWAEIFGSQNEAVPIFLKKQKNCWQYVGLWRCISKSEKADDIQERKLEVGRGDISMVLKLEKMAS